MPQPDFLDSATLRSFDVLVVGSGAAGLYATLCLPSHLRIGLVTKDTVKKGSSNWAQGGIAAAIAPSDSDHLHFEDTLRAGAGLCDARAVQFLVNHAETAIHSLLELGVAFDRKEGQLAMTLEAAHSHPRVLHSADTTGKAIVSTLAAQVLEHSHIHILSHAFVLNVWINPTTGHCQGIRVLLDNQVQWIRASAVILATGGGGQVFSQTTNPSVSTGDGVAMAWRAGAIVRDLEFFQFHPTALAVPGAPRFLISEAVRGEGAYLVDEAGDRFAFNYHESGELAPRDVVSRAIFNHLRHHSTHSSCAYLDLSAIDRSSLRSRFPNIIQTCAKWGVDVFHQTIPVAPAAHYWMGGIATDLMNRTSIPGLYAIGECASTGVHGANRLASNSLLECLVFTAQLAHIDLSPQVSCDNGRSEHQRDHEHEPVQSIGQVQAEMHQYWPVDAEKTRTIRKKLPLLMWNSAGICRHQQTLEQAITMVQVWRSQLLQTHLCQFITHQPTNHPIIIPSPKFSAYLQVATETLNLLDIAHLILKSAAWRTESRGGHYRSDFPKTEFTWQVHTVIQNHHIQGKPIQGKD